MVERLNSSSRKLELVEAGCETIEDQIANAATWLADNWHVAPQPMTRTLREMFGLDFRNAVKAMARAKAIVEVLAR
ncbi:hypothetical protein [Devosia sp. SL43]|uniref:hypothetical protein n=1 Tax=Devosia sp. SL43 TaxID=2806348 RepID=UPI001F170A56|nr:hypothetical protein [Devosia sp. SL43]UJW83990.1 hypothetical protein IM737_11010 [Devosia sp. SL43]